MSTLLTTTATRELKDLLHSLFEGELTLKNVKTHLPLDGHTTVAIYRDGTGIPRHAMIGDLAFANYAGAALSRITPGMAATAIKEKQIPENIRANLDEVMNVCVTLFARGSNSRLVLDKVYYPGELPDDTLRAQLTATKDRTTSQVTIDRYGTGTVTLVSL